MSEMTQNELLQRAKEILVKYDFSHYALYDNRIDLGIEVPKELEAQWKIEYYEKLVETFEWSNQKHLFRIGDVLGFGLVNNNFSLLDKFYEKQLLNYKNIHVESKFSLISDIKVLSDRIKNEKKHYQKKLDIGGNMLCQTAEQSKYVKRLFDLAEEIYSTIDKNKNHLPSDIKKRAFPEKTEEERKELFIKGLEANTSRLRENRKIIGL